METSLHRQLKLVYADADADAEFEVRCENYRIDLVSRGRLVEIQHGSLAAIRHKVRRLLSNHHVLVVKPIVARKRLVRLDAKGGQVIGRRLSPKQGRLLDLFEDLVYFTQVFPHPRLTLETPLVDIEEWRYPGHGRRWRRRARDHQVADQKLLAVRRVARFRTAADLTRLAPAGLPRPFHTGHLADLLGIDRWSAQRIAYCLRETGAAREVGKQGNTRLYVFAEPLRGAS